MKPTYNPSEYNRKQLQRNAIISFWCIIMAVGVVAYFAIRVVFSI